MKLDRDLNDDKLGKYALLNLRKLRGQLSELSPAARTLLHALKDKGFLDCGLPNEPDEFFVIKLRDVYAQAALMAYAEAAIANGDEEWGKEVMVLAQRSGNRSPFCKLPD